MCGMFKVDKFLNYFPLKLGGVIIGNIQAYISLLAIFCAVLTCGILFIFGEPIKAFLIAYKILLDPGSAIKDAASDGVKKITGGMFKRSLKDFVLTVPMTCDKSPFEKFSLFWVLDCWEGKLINR